MRLKNRSIRLVEVERAWPLHHSSYEVGCFVRRAPLHSGGYSRGTTVSYVSLHGGRPERPGLFFLKLLHSAVTLDYVLRKGTQSNW